MHRLLSLFCCLLSAHVLAQDLVITNARIITGTGQVIDQGSIFVLNGRIESVSAGQIVASHTDEINAEGKTVMPAFIDAHRHLFPGGIDPSAWLKNGAEDSMQEFLEAGFTTVLSAGDPVDQVLELRSQINQGEMVGPRLKVVGRVPLAVSSGPRPTVDPARVDISRPPDRPIQAAKAIPHSETRALVQKLAKAGVDAIKTVIITTPGGPETETLAVVADEAAKQGIVSITHAVTVQDTLAAVQANTHYLVHTPHIGILTDEEARTIAMAEIPMSSTLGIFVPTFAESNQRIQQRTGMDNLPRFRDLDPFPMNTLSSAGVGPINARRLWDAGITYAFGTDTKYLPRDTLRHELIPLKLVFSNQDIITMMTQNAAIAVNMEDEIGTLESGKLADIVILDGNPLEDIHALLQVTTVIKEGVVLVSE